MKKEDVVSLARRFFVPSEEPTEDYELNPELEPEPKNEQEGALLLVEVIRSWVGKTSIFCYQRTQRREGESTVDLPENEWRFGYGTSPESDCSLCRRSRQILTKIFGDPSNFNRLPFIERGGNFSYYFRFDLLKYFAENGYDSTVKLIEEERREEEKKKEKIRAELQRKEQERQNSRLEELLGGRRISEELRRQILPYADEDSLVIIPPDVAVVLTRHSRWGSRGGIAYTHQVHVFYKDQVDTKGWRWRDPHDPRNDVPELAVHGIGAVKVEKANNKVVVRVELVNRRFGNRTVSFVFCQQE